MAGVLASLLGNVLRGLLAVLLWLLVTPFWFAWTLAWFVLSYSWALAIAVTALTILFVSWRYRHVGVSFCEVSVPRHPYLLDTRCPLAGISEEGP